MLFIGNPGRGVRGACTAPGGGDGEGSSRRAGHDVSLARGELFVPLLFGTVEHANASLTPHKRLWGV